MYFKNSKTGSFMHDIFSEKIFKITRPNFYDAKNFRTEEDKPYSSYEYGNIQTHGHTKLTVLAKSAEFGKGYLNIFFFFLQTAIWRLFA